ncbi:gamma-glutamyltransferase [candidate division KSB1 bacterium]|nr:gamma-glutamyltransferase [candidate division KSB1 bacterium]
MTTRFVAIWMIFSILIPACEQKQKMMPSENSAAEPAVGANGMVSTAHPLATQAGLEILQANGNAFDAAVAVAAMLNVVEPMMSGIGGYGTILVYDAKTGKTHFLNSSGRIPRAVDSDLFRAPAPNYEENRRGAKAVSTPGNVNAWAAISQRFGAMAWDKLFEPAIKIAERGFSINQLTASFIERSFPEFPDHAKAFYGKEGAPLKAGDLLIQKDLAKSLRQIAEQGAEVVHGGELGEAIDAAMREAGGFLTIKDLRENQAEWSKPISINYRGAQIITASPPATAFPSLIRLGLMSRFDAQALAHNTTAYLHRFAEVTKHAFWCRLRYAGDPEINPPPLDMLLSETYWEEQAASMDLEHAKPFIPPTAFSGVAMHTTHFVVADQWGNIVSATQTLGNLFGSRIMPAGTGIWLNNSLAYCTFEPKGNPMDAHAGRHKLSGDCPTIIMRDGKPWIAIGTPGGHTIGQTVPQMVMNLIDFNMNVQQAIAAPRISFVEPDLIAVEESIPGSVRDALVSYGHKIRVVERLGNAHGLAIEYDAAGKPVKFSGGADPRGEGLARGY